MIVMLLGTGETKVYEGADLFCGVALPPRRFWRSFTASLLLHCGLVPTLLLVDRLLTDAEEEALRHRMAMIRPLQLQVSDLFYAPAPGPAPAKPDPRPARPEERRPAPRVKAAPSKDAVGKPAPRRFELPEVAHKVDLPQTLLQLQTPPEMALQQQVRLPNIVFWSEPQLPKPIPKRFLQPGSKTPVIRTPSALDAPPKLEMPNKELRVSDLKISGGVITENAALPRAPSNTIPVRVFRPGAGASQPVASVSLDAIAGDPVNVIAFSENPGPLERTLLIPPGSQLGRLPGASGDGNADSAGLSSGEGGSAGASGRGASRSGANGSGGTGEGVSGAGGGNGSSQGGAGQSVGSGSGRSGAGGSGSGGTGLGGPGGSGRGTLQALSLSPPSALPSNVAIRMIHPVGGAADVVVQSSSSEVMPDTTGFLSGKPVYTVFVHTGTPKDWILQYCRPAAAELRTTTSSNVVTLDAPAPIKAPFALVTVAPPVSLERRTDPILVHGLLDDSGHLKALYLIREKSLELRHQILPYLEQWEFRPGTRDGLPVLLEILLVIPANQV